MVAPLDVPDPSGRKVLATVTDDEGIYLTTVEGLAKLRPVKPGSTVSFATQTHPADGNCGMIVTSRKRAIEIQVLGFGQARVKKGFMAQATVPAARQALTAVRIDLSEVKAIKAHNPFAVTLPHQESDFAFFTQYTSFGSSLRFQPNCHFPTIPSPKRQEA